MNETTLGSDNDLNDFMRDGIKIKTMTEYTKDIKRFQEYLNGRGEAARVCNYLLDPINEGATSIHSQAYELINYARRLSEDETLTPSAFDAQFYAIRRFMLNNIRDLRVFDMECVKEAKRIARDKVAKSRKEVVKAMDTAQKATYDARYGIKMPFTEEMMIAHRIDYFESTSASIEDKMAYMATALGYHIGNRPSESSSNGPLTKDDKGKCDEDHNYIVEDIQYQIHDGSFICGVEIDETNKEGIQHITVMVDTHKGETLKMRASKGATKRQPNEVRRDNGPMELQLFNDLIEWPGIANLRLGDHFFSRNIGERRNLTLTTKAMVTRMKITAEKQGINPTLISAKSLRKALGTDLTRSNVPQTTINACGRWSTNSTVCASNYALTGAGNVSGTMSEGVIRSSNRDIQRWGRNREALEQNKRPRIDEERR